MSATSIFNTKYNEFARDLQTACPELTDAIERSLCFSTGDRLDIFKEYVLPHCSPSRNSDTAPAYVLPGVKMPQEIWDTLSDKSKKAIQEYLTILSFTYLLDYGSAADLSGNGFSSSWANKMMNEMKEKIDSFDFKGIAEKIAGLFGAAAADGKGIPQIPEKFLKGQIAKLAEEIVKEFRMEDFGIDPAEIEAAGNDPTKALNIITEMFTKNPQILQGTIQKLGKRLQEKIQSGALRPQELVAEAEELMKTFSENQEFVQLMESFRRAFSFEGMEGSRGARDSKDRLSIVRERLKKKLDAKKAAAGTGGASGKK